LFLYECKLTTKAFHSTLMAPELIFAMISFTGCPSTVAPSELLYKNIIIISLRCSENLFDGTSESSSK
jgi:hypothetical protein